uniref:tRNA isopentenyltransferase 1 n=1 Tax=Oncorhynchus mykiss TaxID=8022 RepID=A0A8C7TRJ8_ONCMY
MRPFRSILVYRGLDIITNKVTAEERAQCSHHMISFVDPLVSSYTVVDFRNKALALISFMNVLPRAGLSLCPVLIDTSRSLQVHADTGVPHSHWLEEQRGQEGGDVLGGPLRYPDPCIFWLHADMEAIDERLDRRVDQMLLTGLIDELRDFHLRFNQQKIQDQSQDYQHGIFQSIGFKEFHEYLTCPDETTQEVRETLRNQGVTMRPSESVSLSLSSGPGDNVPAVYGLDVTDVSQWEETVLSPALLILDSLTKGERPTVEPMRVEGAGKRNKRSRHTCELCDKVIIGDLEWTAHLKSKKHHYHVRKRRKCEPEPEPASHQPQGTTPPPTSTTDGPTLGNSTTLAPGSAEACGEPESPGTSSTEKEAPVL